MNGYMMFYAKGALSVNCEVQLAILWFYECGTSCCHSIFYL